VADVFLSYNREDQAKAKIIAEALEADGFEVWWDTVLRAGQTYDEVTERQLRDAWAVVVLWSSRSVQSKWVRAEATLGDRKSALIPVMIEPCDRPIMFELIQTADLTQWDGDLKDTNWLAFLADVREHVERKRAAKPPSAPVAASQSAAQRAAAPAPSRAATSSTAQAPPRRAKKSNLGLLFVGAALLAIAVVAFLLLPRTQGGVAPPPVVPSAPIEAAVAPGARDTPASAEQATFRDCDECPEMARLAGGAFMMGSPANEPGRNGWEGPQHNVQVAPFAIGSREVTFAEWDACVAAGGCGRYAPTDRGWGRGARPALMVSWNDAQAYVRWLSERTGRAYRLPSEAQWEFAARGGTATAYWWGDRYDAAQAPHGQTSEAGAYAANGFGLFDVTGNVAEWVEDCYVNGFTDAPTDGSAMVQGNCGQRVVRGGSWRDNPQSLRIAARSRIARGTRDGGVGFRVAAAP
jgi:formylglycine-generating enzyme required for sulfatase activity